MNDNFCNNFEKSGFGRIFHDNNGNRLLGFSDFIGISTSLCVELHSILLNDLMIAQTKRFINSIIESYLSLIVNFASHETSQSHPYDLFIQKIHHFRTKVGTSLFNIILEKTINMPIDM